MVEHKLANKVILVRNECFWLTDVSCINYVGRPGGGFATFNAFGEAFLFPSLPFLSALSFLLILLIF